MAANQLTVKAWKGVLADILTASIAESGKLFFYVDTSASTHLVKVCRKVAGVATWQDLAIASEVVSTATLTTRGDLLIRGASEPERLALGLAGFRPSSDGTDVIWSATTKANTAGSRPTATSLYAGVVYYATDTGVPSLGVQDGGSSYAWHTLATPLYSAAADRPTAGAGYTTCVHYATDTTTSSLCVRTGASTYAWVSLGGVSLASTAAADLGAVASAGVGTTAARADHVHSVAGLVTSTGNQTITDIKTFTALKLGIGGSTFDCNSQTFTNPATASGRWKFQAGLVPFVGTVAEIAAIGSPTVGLMAFATNGRVGAEGAGTGTGCPVYYGNGAWRRFEDGAAVAA